MAPSVQATDGATIPTATSSLSLGQALTGPVSLAGPSVTVVSASGLRLSQDGGKSWSDMTFPGGVSGASVMAVSAAPSRPVFLAAKEATGNAIDLFGRSASDTAWTESRLTPLWPSRCDVAGPVDTVAITPGQAGFVAVSASVIEGTATADNSIFVSQDDGKSFVQHQEQCPSEANIIWDSLAFATPQLGVVVVGPTQEGLIHTFDGGATWTKSVVPTLPEGGSFELGQPVVVGSNIQVPISIGMGSSTASFAFLVSTDGGASFTTSPYLSIPGGQSVSATIGQRTWVISSTGTTIYETSDNGQTWASVKATGLPQDLASLALTGSELASAVVVTRGCTSYKSGCWTKKYLVGTTDGGRTWAAF